MDIWLKLNSFLLFVDWRLKLNKKIIQFSWNCLLHCLEGWNWIQVIASFTCLVAWLVNTINWPCLLCYHKVVWPLLSAANIAPSHTNSVTHHCMGSLISCSHCTITLSWCDSSLYGLSYQLLTLHHHTLMVSLIIVWALLSAANIAPSHFHVVTHHCMASLISC